MEEPQLVGPDIDRIIHSLANEDAEALANDLLRDSDTVCRKNIQAMQDVVLEEYERLIVEEMKKTPELPPAKAQEEAEWRLRNALRTLQERLMSHGIREQEVQRQRDQRILERVRGRRAADSSGCQKRL